MSRFRQVVLIFTLVIAFQGVRAQSADTKIDSIIKLITIDTYHSHFDSLRTREGSTRKVIESTTQSLDHDACRDYIYRSFSRYLGKDRVYLHHFEEGNYGGLANIVGIKPGWNPGKGILLLGAHYDSSNGKDNNPMSSAPGANDNGTGLAAILEIARVLSEFDLECTVIFAAWDFEEQYTDWYPTGSNRWYTDHVRGAKLLKRRKGLGKEQYLNKQFIANINFDMFGNPHDTLEGKPVLWACSGNREHKLFINDYISIFNRYVPDIKVLNRGVLTYSDHYTFANRGILSVENLESGYNQDPYYHTHFDNIDNPNNIDFTFSVDVTRGGFAFVLSKSAFVDKKSDMGHKKTTFPGTIKESIDGYQVEPNTEDYQIEIYDFQGRKMASNKHGNVYTFTPTVKGLYCITATDTKTVKTFRCMLQGKDAISTGFENLQIKRY